MDDVFRQIRRGSFGGLSPRDVEELNRGLTTLERLARGDRPLAESPSFASRHSVAGTIVTDLTPRGFWAQTVGAAVDGAHAWTQVYEHEAGLWLPVEPAIAGTTTEGPAYEVNGGEVAADTVVWLLPAEGGASGPFYHFEAAGGGSGGGHTIQDEGTSLPDRTKLDFVGAGVTVTDDAANDKTVVTISGGGGGGHTIQDEGTSLPDRTRLNFVGSGVTVTDDSANNATVVTISATGGDTTYPPDVDLIFEGAGSISGVGPLSFNVTVVVSAPWCFAYYYGHENYDHDLTGSVDNFAGSTLPWWRFTKSTSADYRLKGIVAPTGTCDGIEVLITNLGPGTLILPHEELTSTAANRLATPNADDWPVRDRQSVRIRYDRGITRWRVTDSLDLVMVGATAGSAGAGGLVPIPAAGEEGKFLRGDATWAAVAGAAFSGARVYHTAHQTTASGTSLALAFNTERFDTDAYHDTVTNNSRFTVTVAGKYLIGGHINFAATSGGYRRIEIFKNGNTLLAEHTIPGPGSTDEASLSISTVADLAVNDYVELRARQNSGGSLQVTASLQYSPEFWIVRQSGGAGGAGGGAGTVTSVELTMPAEFSVAGSPITSSGTLAVTKATQAANLLYAGPTSGSAAQPAFRTLAGGDVGLTTKGDLLTFGTALTRLGVGTNGHVLTADSTQTAGLKWAATATGAAVATSPGGRLTGLSGTPVATFTSSTTVYYTPHIHNGIQLWDGSAWVTGTFSEVSLALAPMTANVPADIFGYLSGGVLALEKLNWSSGTVRTTDLVRQDGRLVKSGDPTRLYLGTIGGPVIHSFTDEPHYRGCWNAYNRCPRKLLKKETGQWSYSGGFRVANANTANRVQVVLGLSEEPLTANVQALANVAGSVTVTIGVGVDSTSTNSADAYGTNVSAFLAVFAHWRNTLLPGYHSLYWLEYAGSSVTFYGDASNPTNYQSAIFGEVHA